MFSLTFDSKQKTKMATWNVMTPLYHSKVTSTLSRVSNFFLVGLSQCFSDNSILMILPTFSVCMKTVSEFLCFNGGLVFTNNDFRIPTFLTDQH